jgi:hypothetical protein
MTAWARWSEFGVLYLVAPVLFALLVRRVGYRGAMFPVLWFVALACLGVLLADPSFDRGVLWRMPSREHLTIVAVRFVVLACLLAVLVRTLSPGTFASLPRRSPRLFAMLVVGYPLVSVLPQGIIWRVFLVHRYRVLFEGTELLVAASLAFALAHVTFRNVVAIVLTGVGGALFAHTYLTTGSMWLATLEHGAYGVAAFGLGLGQFLYLGGGRRNTHSDGPVTVQGAGS